MFQVTIELLTKDGDLLPHKIQKIWDQGLNKTMAEFKALKAFDDFEVRRVSRSVFTKALESLLPATHKTRLMHLQI